MTIDPEYKIDYDKLAAEVEKVRAQKEQNIPTVKKEDPWGEHLSLSRGPNFITRKQCGKIENPKGLTKSFKACPECQANTISKDAGICPICGNDKPDEGWDDGINIDEYDLSSYN